MVPNSQAQPIQSLKLSPAVTGLVELRRLQREIEALDEFAEQSAIREPGKQQALPRTSRLLEAVATDNSLQILQPEHRQALAAFFESVEQSGPRIHMSFAVEANLAVSIKIVEWLRAKIHPFALLEVGLQPSIAAGVIMRTNNKVFDFSLRHRFAEAQTLLVESLEQFEASQSAVAEAQVAAVSTASAPEAKL